MIKYVIFKVNWQAYLSLSYQKLNFSSCPTISFNYQEEG